MYQFWKTKSCVFPCIGSYTLRSFKGRSLLRIQFCEDASKPVGYHVQVGLLWAILVLPFFCYSPTYWTAGLSYQKEINFPIYSVFSFPTCRQQSAFSFLVEYWFVSVNTCLFCTLHLPLQFVLLSFWWFLRIILFLCCFLLLWHCNCWKKCLS